MRLTRLRTARTEAAAELMPLLPFPTFFVTQTHPVKVIIKEPL